MPVLYIDDPQIRIELFFARQPVFNSRGIDPFGFMHQSKPACRVIFCNVCLRRRAKQRVAAIEAIKPNENGSRLCGTALAQHGERAFNLGTAQKGRDPDVGAQAHSVERSAAGRGQFFQHARRDLTRHRQFAIALEALNRQLGAGAINAICLNGPIAQPV